MKRLTNQMIEDLALYLEKEDSYFIRYDDKLNELFCCLHGDSVEYYDMNKKEDVKMFIIRLVYFINTKIYNK